MAYTKYGRYMFKVFTLLYSLNKTVVVFYDVCDNYHDNYCNNNRWIIID